VVKCDAPENQGSPEGCQRQVGDNQLGGGHLFASSERGTATKGLQTSGKLRDKGEETVVIKGRGKGGGEIDGICGIPVGNRAPIAKDVKQRRRKIEGRGRKPKSRGI